MANDSNGSGQVSSLFKSNAGKQSLKFRFPDVAIRHLVLATPSGTSWRAGADIQERCS